MKTSLPTAEDQLTDPVYRSPARSPTDRGAVLQAARAAGLALASPGPSAARSQDFLYDDDGLPE